MIRGLIMSFALFLAGAAAAQTQSVTSVRLQTDFEFCTDAACTALTMPVLGIGYEPTQANADHCNAIATGDPQPTPEYARHMAAILEVIASSGAAEFGGFVTFSCNTLIETPVLNVTLPVTIPPKAVP